MKNPDVNVSRRPRSVSKFRRANSAMMRETVSRHAPMVFPSSCCVGQRAMIVPSGVSSPSSRAKVVSA